MKIDLDLCREIFMEVETKSNPFKWPEGQRGNITKATSRLRAMLISLFLVLFSVLSTEAQTARDVAQKTLPSVVLLMMLDANSQPVSLGSGFFVRDDIVATNLHVIGKAVKGYAKLVGQNTKYEINGIVGIDKSRDLVILSIKGIKSSLLPIGDCKSQKVGDAVYVAGNPLGLEGTFSQGIISGIRQIGPDFLFQITAPISPGSSGGPLLNEKGEVIGVAVATFKGGQNLNFAIPSSYLISLLSNPKPIMQIREGRQLKQAKSIIKTIIGDSNKAVLVAQPTWDDYGNPLTGKYTFSIVNKMDKPIKNIYCLNVFRDIHGNPVDYELVEYRGIIPPGAAKRLHGQVDKSIRPISAISPALANPYGMKSRILQFEFEE